MCNALARSINMNDKGLVDSDGFGLDVEITEIKRERIGLIDVVE